MDKTWETQIELNITTRKKQAIKTNELRQQMNVIKLQ